VGIELGDGRARVVLVEGEGERARLIRAEEVPLPPRSSVRGEVEDPEAVGKALGERVSAWGARGLRARVTSGPRTAVRRLTVPAMKPKELGEFLRWQKEKLFPFGEEVELASRVVGRRGGEMEVEVAACPRRVVERAVSALQAAGLVPEGVVPEQELWPHLWEGRGGGNGAVLLLDWGGEEVRISLCSSGGLPLGRRTIRSPAAAGTELRRAVEPLLMQCRDGVGKVVPVGEATEERRRAAGELAGALGAELVSPGVEPRFALALALASRPRPDLNFLRRRGKVLGPRATQVLAGLFFLLLLSDLGWRLVLYRERVLLSPRSPLQAEIRAQGALEELLARVERKKRLLDQIGSPWPLPRALTALVQGMQPGLSLEGVRVEGEGVLTGRGKSQNPLLPSRMKKRLLDSRAFSSAEVQVTEGGEGGLSFVLRAVMEK
jgi:hypothetical protein